MCITIVNTDFNDFQLKLMFHQKEVMMQGYAKENAENPARLFTARRDRYTSRPLAVHL